MKHCQSITENVQHRGYRGIDCSNTSKYVGVVDSFYWSRRVLACHSSKDLEHQILPFPERTHLGHAESECVDAVCKRDSTVLGRGRAPTHIATADIGLAVAFVVVVVRPADAAAKDLADAVETRRGRRLALVERAHDDEGVVFRDVARHLADLAELVHERAEFGRALGQRERLVEHAANHGLAVRRVARGHDGGYGDVEDGKGNGREVRARGVAGEHPPQRLLALEHIGERSVQCFADELYGRSIRTEDSGRR